MPMIEGTSTPSSFAKTTINLPKIKPAASSSSSSSSSKKDKPSSGGGVQATTPDAIKYLSKKMFQAQLGNLMNTGMRGLSNLGTIIGQAGQAYLGAGSLARGAALGVSQGYLAAGNAARNLATSAITPALDLNRNVDIPNKSFAGPYVPPGPGDIRYAPTAPGALPAQQGRGLGGAFGAPAPQVAGPTNPSIAPNGNIPGSLAMNPSYQPNGPAPQQNTSQGRHPAGALGSSYGGGPQTGPVDINAIRPPGSFGGPQEGGAIGGAPFVFTPPSNATDTSGGGLGNGGFYYPYYGGGGGGGGGSSNKRWTWGAVLWRGL